MKIEEMKKTLNDFSDKKIIDSDNMEKVFEAIDLGILYIEDLEYEIECLKKEIEDIKQDVEDNYRKIPYEEMI